MRRNRLDPENPEHVSVSEHPAAYNRESRRAAGYRKPVHSDAMRAFYAENEVLPRSVRRLMRDPEKAQRRVLRHQAKVVKEMSNA